MPGPLLFSTKNNVENLDTCSGSIVIHSNEDEDNENYNWHELTITEHHTLLTSLNRICVYWRQIFFNKIRFILKLIFVTMLNTATRLTCFTRQKAAVRSTTPLSSIVTIPSNRTFENDRDCSSTALINYNSEIDLSSLETSPMANILVQQQTPNINIHQTTSTQDENLLPMSHSVDDRLFFYQPNSTCLLQLFQRFASEPQMSKFQSTSNGFLNISNAFLPLNKSDKEEDEEEINNVNCDKIEPVITEDVKSNELDNSSTATIIDDLDEDILLNITSSLNLDRHFRRRKRRSPLTNISTDEIQPIVTDSIEKIDNNNNHINIQEKKSEEIHENSLPILLENVSLEEKQETNLPSHNRFRGRRFRYRSYRQTSQPTISDNPIEFSVSTKTSNITPPLSPTSPPPATVCVSSTSPTGLTGGLKRTRSIGTTKKMVRFADSIGRELAQVQYIRSLTDDDNDELKEFSNLKNNLYLPSTFHFEHKPWSFDVALSSKQISHTPSLKRFCCLYRQPNSEHPDIYLHEIWKSQIKLEHADIRLKSSSTGEQYLYGTVWVTNASYWKNVAIKYTFNRWLNTYEYEAQHRCHSNDFRNIDQFQFSIDIPHDVDRIEFVLRYYVNGQEYWDNNEGKNYTLETESVSIPQTTISLPHDCDFNEMRFY